MTAVLRRFFLPDRAVLHWRPYAVVVVGALVLGMEYVDGQPLDVYARGISVRERLELFIRVCEAVSYAHQRLIVHRDLKPSNILVGRDGVVKLLDFGIAKLLDAPAGDSATRVFTPEYAAPEQVRGDVVTTSVDIHDRPLSNRLRSRICAPASTTIASTSTAIRPVSTRSIQRTMVDVALTSRCHHVLRRALPSMP